MKTLEQLGISPAPWVKGDAPAQWDVFSQHQDNWIGIGFVSQSVNHEADARLIAAAPELYEAIAALLNCAEKEAPFTTESGMSIAMDMARKAIAKAGGEE